MGDPVKNFRVSLDDEARRAFDPYVHAITQINSTHRVVHDGLAFHAVHRTASLATATSLELLVVTGALRAHMNGILFSVTGAPCDIATFEGTTTSSDGTLMTSYNRNRNSSNAATTLLYHTPTVTGDGTQFHDRLVPSAGKDTGTVAPTLGEEWVLAPNTKHLIRLTNNSGGIIQFTTEFLWYEPNYES